MLKLYSLLFNEITIGHWDLLEFSQLKNQAGMFMQKKQVTLIVRLKAKKGMGMRLEQAAVNLIPLTRSEPGCIKYNFHSHPQEAESFLFYENWINQEALDKHLQMPYLVAFKTLLEEILSEPAEFTFWNMRE